MQAWLTFLRFFGVLAGASDSAPAVRLSLEGEVPLPPAERASLLWSTSFEAFMPSDDFPLDLRVDSVIMRDDLG